MSNGPAREAATLRSRAFGMLMAFVAGLALLLGLLLSAPSRLDLNVGGAIPATLAGMHPRELHYGRQIRWTDGRARLDIPAIVGIAPVGLELELAAFMGRHGDTLLLLVDPSTTKIHTLGDDWDVVWMALPPSTRALTLHLRSASHSAPGDARRLGVRLDRVTIVNAPRWRALLAIDWWEAVIIVLVGAASWCLGRAWGAAIPGRRRPVESLMGAVAVAAVGVGLALVRPWMLHPAGLRALGGALVLAASAFWLMRAPWRTTTLRTLASPASVAAGVAVCWLALAAISMHFFVDVPRWDIWDVVDLIERGFDGALRPHDWWRPHNEHRPLTARLVILPNALWFGWNHWLEFAVLMAATGWLLLVYTRFVSTTQAQTQRVTPAVLIPVAVVACSLTQWENWLRGYHVHLIMGAIGPVLTLYWLATGARSWRRLALAAGAALVGVLSFGTGLLAWPLGALAIAARRERGWRGRLAAWAAVGFAVVLLYRSGLPHRPGLSEVTVHSAWELLRIGVGVLVYVAMPLMYLPEVFATPASPQQAAVVGGSALAVLLAGGLAWRHWRADRAGSCAWLFPTLLVAFGIGAGTLAALGRTSMGLYAMTASRYSLFSACFWTGLFLLLALRDDNQGLRWRRATTTLLVVLTVMALSMWPRALPYMAADADGGWRAREDLRRGDVDAAATVLFPNALELDRMRLVLVRHRLSIFRP